MTKAVPPYSLVSRLLAALLLVAGGLKVHDLFAAGPGGARWLNAGVAAFELLFGLWLFFGLFPRWSRILALGCFVGFLDVALSQTLEGQRSCGCFGKVPVWPWVAAGIDLAAAILLVIAQPGTDVTGRAMRRRLAGFGASAFTVAVAFAVLLAVNTAKS